MCRVVRDLRRIPTRTHGESQEEHNISPEAPQQNGLHGVGHLQSWCGVGQFSTRAALCLLVERARPPGVMGNVVGCRQTIRGHASADGIYEFEHCFAASLEDASPGVVPAPHAGYTPSTGPPPAVRKSSVGTISEPLTGRLITVHMMETELVVKEPVGVSERTVACIPYAAIRQLTWDHSQSALKVGHTRSAWRVEGGGGGGGGDGDSDGNSGTADRGAKPEEGELVFISFRVENSIDLEDELQRRASAEAKRTKAAGQSTPSAPDSVYLGMFASSHKPKPFQRKRPNLSSTVAGGELPSLQVGA